MSTILVLAAVLVLHPQVQPPGQPQAAQPSIAAAQARLAAKDPQGAIRILDQVVAATPANFRAWRTLGSVHRQVNAFDRALAAYQKVAELRPDDPQAMFDVGVSYAMVKDTDRAFEWLTKARATKRVDMTQMEGVTALDPLRDDPRFAALVPTRLDFEKPFVEDVTILREWVGEAANDQFGWIARAIGDVDGDGASDVVTSAPTNGAGGPNGGRIYVYSSRRGTLLWTAEGEAQDQLGIGLEAAGDINGDDAGDVIAAAPFGGYAKVYDGRNGTVLLTLQTTSPHEAFGRHTQGIGDVNNDGTPDLIVGAPSGPNSPAEFSGRAYIFSGKDGALLLTLEGERGGDGFGSAVTGHSRGKAFVIAVGAPSAGPQRRGRTYVYTALSSKPAFVVDADDTGAALGAMFLSVPGDLDGDGVDDVYSSDFPNSAKGPSTGRVYVHSGKTGAPILTLTGEGPGEGFGTSPSDAGDVDGDGVPDLIVGAWQYAGAAQGGGRAYLYSGKTGELLKTFTCRTPGDTFGFDAVGIGDVDGDRTVDLLVTSAWSGVRGFRSGRMFIVSSGVKPMSK
jgi:hypothetical protein